MAKKAKKAKKNDGDVLPVMDTALTCGFYDDCIPVHELEDIEAEGRTYQDKFLTPEDVAFSGEDVWVLQSLEKLADDAGDSFFCLDDEVFPTIAVDTITVQGMPLPEFLAMYNIDSDPPSLANGIPVTQYVDGMTYERIYPIVSDDGGYEHGINAQSSHETEGMRRAVVKSYNTICRITDRCGRRYGRPPEQKPRYKDISRASHRLSHGFLQTVE